MKMLRVLRAAVLAAFLSVMLLISAPSGSGYSVNRQALKDPAAEAGISRTAVPEEGRERAVFRSLALPGKGPESSESAVTRESAGKPSGETPGESDNMAALGVLSSPEPAVSIIMEMEIDVDVDMGREIAEIVNRDRAEAGLSPLEMDTSLCQAAIERSSEMAWYGYLEHVRPDGREWYSVMEDYGVSAREMGENIASGYDTALEAEEGWLKSEAHRVNIMDSGFDSIGVGVVRADDGTRYFTQLFTGQAQDSGGPTGSGRDVPGGPGGERIF